MTGLVRAAMAKSASVAATPKRFSAVTAAAGPQVNGWLWRQTPSVSISVREAARSDWISAGPRNGKLTRIATKNAITKQVMNREAMLRSWVNGAVRPSVTAKASSTNRIRLAAIGRSIGNCSHKPPSRDSRISPTTANETPMAKMRVEVDCREAHRPNTMPVIAISSIPIVSSQSVIPLFLLAAAPTLKPSRFGRR
ncbi:MAG: hypothetical protein ACYSOT_01395 [Planctomycetota bacterium]